MAAGMIHIGAAAAACEVWPGTRGGDFETVVSCEIGAFGSDVLASLFPAAYHHKDIRTLTKTIIDERLIPRFGADYGRRTILTGGGSHRACTRQTSPAPAGAPLPLARNAAHYWGRPTALGYW